MKKLKVGFFALTGCFGCLLSFLFNENELSAILENIELKAFPFIKSENMKEGFDYIFLEGLVANHDDLENLKKIRKSCTYLVALGTCACTACIPAIRNFISKNKYAHLLYKKIDRIADIEPTPIDRWVKVDYYLPGCPPSEEEVLNFIKDIALGKEPRLSLNPVCFDCRLNGNTCLLDEGKICLGPITKAGCNAVCPSNGFECYGCRGLSGDENIEAFIKMLEDRGFERKEIIQRLMTFIGIKFSNKYGMNLK